MNDTSPFGQVELTTLLAEHASIAEGKLTVVGAGWDHLSQPVPTALAGLATVPYNMANTEFVIRVELWDADGAPVLLPGANGPLWMEQRCVAAPRPGTKRGNDLRVPFAMNMGPLPLEPGSYQWRFTVDGRAETRWHLNFVMVGAGAPSGR